MAMDSDFFGGELPPGSRRVRIRHDPLPDGRIRIIRQHYAESVPPGGVLVEIEREEILCEWAGDQWMVPGESGEIIDGFALCAGCARRTRIIRLLRRLFSPFLRQDGQPPLGPTGRLLR